MSPNVKAFLIVVRTGEGTLGEDGYRRVFGGDLLTDLSDHPRKIIHKGKYFSSAAGAYQARMATWNDFVKSVGKRDFSPASQDEFAIWCLKRRHALDDVEAGRFEIAVEKCKDEWASLPGSTSGQPQISMERAKRVYAENAGQIAIV